MNVSSDNWHEANQRYLTAALARVRSALERRLSRDRANSDSGEQECAPKQALREIAAAMPAPPALERLCTTFSLSPFEQDVLLLCAGIELDSGFVSLCASAQSDPMRPFPTFSLALAALPGPHWSAITPASPLRAWRMIEVGTGSALTLSPLRIDERILHYLTGVQHLDERLVGLIEPPGEVGILVPSHRALVDRIAGIWAQASGSSSFPVIQLCGEETTGKRSIATQACAALGLNLSVMSSQAIPVGPVELEALIRLWEREAALSGCSLLLDCEEADATDMARENAIARMIEYTSGALILACRERRRTRQRSIIAFDVLKPTLSEQREVWQIALEAFPGLNGSVNALVSQFSLSAETIRSVIKSQGSGVKDRKEVEGITPSIGDSGDPAQELWDICRAQARPRLENLAQRIEPAATWEDLVLPAAQKQTMREVAMHVRQRVKVYEAWGFASKSSRGLGISALFSGASGTGKTMAAEVLARDLRLDLYRIDLSSVVSKYIGETEKNLKRVFDAAEEGGAILLFDEADALFGKRSEVKDSHDRYANIEISYLLQRMEAYRGLAILTTNMKNALDTAFLRRIRFIVQFPFPDAAQRIEIWRHIFPASTPVDGLDMHKLARLNIAGGNIRNIALNAAFLAADTGEPVGMRHLLSAVRTEYAKLEKPLTEAEIGGWR